MRKPVYLQALPSTNWLLVLVLLVLVLVPVVVRVRLRALVLLVLPLLYALTEPNQRPLFEARQSWRDITTSLRVGVMLRA